MRSLETAYLTLTSPTGKSIHISKIRLWDVELTSDQKKALQHIVRETGKPIKGWYEEVKVTVDEMRLLLEISILTARK